MPSYVLSNAWEAERRRLHLLEAAHDPASRARILALGVPSHARCLEMGAGGGSMAAWLADVVAPSGSVVAADLDPRHVEPLAAVRPNLTARRHELLADPLPERSFDLVHARALIEHLEDREGAVAELANALDSGGWIVIEEFVWFPLGTNPPSPLRSAFEVFDRAMDAVGCSYTWGHEVPRVYERLGLRDVGAGADVPYFTGGSAYAEFVELTFQQLRDLTRQHGLDDPAYDAAVAMLRESREWWFGPAVLSSWARKP